MVPAAECSEQEHREVCPTPTYSPSTCSPSSSTAMLEAQVTSWIGAPCFSKDSSKMEKLLEKLACTRFGSWKLWIPFVHSAPLQGAFHFPTVTTRTKESISSNVIDLQWAMGGHVIDLQWAVPLASACSEVHCKLTN